LGNRELRLRILGTGRGCRGKDEDRGESGLRHESETALHKRLPDRSHARLLCRLAGASAEWLPGCLGERPSLRLD